MMLGYLNALATVLAMVTFLGIVWWAFSSKRKKRQSRVSHAAV